MASTDINSESPKDTSSDKASLAQARQAALDQEKQAQEVEKEKQELRQLLDQAENTQVKPPIQPESR